MALGPEEGQASPPWQSMSDARLARKRWFLVAVVVVAQILALALAYRAGENSSITTATSDQLPMFHEETLVLSKDPLFDQPSSPIVDQAWDSLLPTQNGFISVDVLHDTRHPWTSTASHDRQLGGLTWSHQYHCLVWPFPLWTWQH
jgi:hypothetical protein